MQKMLTWLDTAISESRVRQQTLVQDQRQDEAVFEKVQENIYDVFRTVLNVALRQHGDSAAARNFFELRMQQIPAAWESSLQAARTHNNTEKAHIEQIKLTALAAIREAWQHFQEENHE